MFSRREFIQKLTGTSLFFLNNNSFAQISELLKNSPLDKTPLEFSSDEIFWKQISNSFLIDRSMINLNNGGVSPSPISVIDSLKKSIDYSNLAPSFHMWKFLEPKIEEVRERLALQLDCDKEEIAITRNASESLQNIQQGLNFNPADEFITTFLDYPRMLNTFSQLERRFGVKVVQVKYPVPLINKEDYIEAVAKAITPRTKAILISHVCFCTGQILPVKEIARIAHSKGIELICDSAHSFNHIPFKISDLECDYLGSSLHKWSYAPIGTGLLYVKKNLIQKIWPLMAAPESMNDNIRKFEEIGTHPASVHNAIIEALDFNNLIGIERKIERLRFLNKIWINRIKDFPGVKFHVNINDDSNWGGIIHFAVDGINSHKLSEYLFTKHKIFTVPVIVDNIDGLRISPNVYTSADEMNIFADTLLTILNGNIQNLKN